MTTPSLDTDRIASLEKQLATVADDIAFLTAVTRAEQARRASWDDLKADLLPVAGGAMETATRELESLRQDVDIDEVIRLLRALAVAAPTLHRSVDALQRLAELAEEMVPLSGDAVAALTDKMAAAEDRGYFDFAAAGLGVVDQVVTSFDRNDVEQLGDNVVTILNTVKDLTQPEMLAVVQRMVGALHQQQAAIEREPADPPGFWALVKRMRDPNVRRGIGRALNTLGSVSAETGPQALHEIHDLSKKGDMIHARDNDRRS